jgi:DNA-3-methyladenine glycosylase
LPRGFYQRNTVDVARDLLGKVVLRELPEGIVAVRLSEVEAYLGVSDPAAHTYRGRETARTATMWGEAGRLYVYFTYGMHHCCNVVTCAPRVPEAVLLRAATALYGEAILLERRAGRGGRLLLDGPARLCQALGIDRTADGCDLTTGSVLWLVDDGARVADEAVLSGPRIGVAYAGEAAAWPLRFRLASGRSGDG